MGQSVRGRGRRWASILLLLVAAVSASKASEAPEIPFLFEISPPGHVASSYLVGTLHASGPEFRTLLKRLEPLIESVEVVATEVALDPPGLHQLMKAMGTPPGTQWTFDRMPPALATRVRHVLEADFPGTPEYAWTAFEPWALYLLAAQSQLTGVCQGQPLDMQLYLRAKALGRVATGIETIEQHLRVFRALSDNDVWSLFEGLLDQREVDPTFAKSSYDRLQEAYMAGDANRLLALTASEFALIADERALEERIRDGLLHQRDRNMAHWIRTELTAHPDRRYLVAVGALHLVSETGLPVLLQDSGWRVRRLSRFPIDKSLEPGIGLP